MGLWPSTQVQLAELNWTQGFLITISNILSEIITVIALLLATPTLTLCFDPATQLNQSFRLYLSITLHSTCSSCFQKYTSSDRVVLLHFCLPMFAAVSSTSHFAPSAVESINPGAPHFHLNCTHHATTSLGRSVFDRFHCGCHGKHRAYFFFTGNTYSESKILRLAKVYHPFLGTMLQPT
ncbi:hypothetical protein C8J57DRAFT_1255042 [Mycena rebaudengoi]|nr:hypothetical protein C8J57DRAFT_1255042 [Mycena rebaudengoi]